MPDEVDIKVLGADELERTLKAAAEDLQHLKSAPGQAAAVIASAARAAAPRRTGRLAASVRAGESSGQAQVDVTAAYAGPVHWGWPSRHIDPQPFATGAARSTEGTWIKFYEAELQKALDQVKGA